MGVHYYAAQYSADQYSRKHSCREQASDIVMVLDRSASLAGEPLENLQEAAKTFINIIARNSNCGCTEKDRLGYGNRIGIVSFADHASMDAPLVTSVESLYNAVNALCAGGKTNHAEAFTRAGQTFEKASDNQRVIVIFTDGHTTAGGTADRIAREMRRDGVVIYAIGLDGEDEAYEDALNEWASNPNEQYVAIAPTTRELKKLFADLAETLCPKKHDCDENGEEETANLGHGCNCHQNDAQANGVVVYPEDCPATYDICCEGCSDALVVDAGNTELMSMGRIVQANVTVHNVCPGKRVALGCVLTETDNDGNEYHRGTKAMTLPAHNRSSCCDVQVRRIHFVLPEDISQANGCNGMCGQRNFKVRFIAHHIDSDYQCCDGEVTLR